jgi:hypothetical protein
MESTSTAAAKTAAAAPKAPAATAPKAAAKPPAVRVCGEDEQRREYAYPCRRSQ